MIYKDKLLKNLQWNFKKPLSDTKILLKVIQKHFSDEI